MTDFVRGKGAGALGTRLRRLSESLDREIQAIYRAHDAGFEPRWFPVVTALLEHDALSVGELAALIGITHAAVSQVRGELLKNGFILVTVDKADKRRQLLALSAKGRRECEKLEPLWDAISAATRKLCASEVPQLLDQLAALDGALAREPMQQRVAREWNSKTVKPASKGKHHA